MSTTYEPRALWEVLTLDTSDAAVAEAPFLRGTRAFWRNGSRHPMVLTRLTLAAVNYMLREHTTVPVTSNLLYDNCSGVVSKFQIEISAPYRQRIMRQRVPVSSFVAAPGWLGTRYDRDAPYKGALYGAYYKQFDKMLSLPSHGMLDIGLTGWTRVALPYMVATGYPRFSFGFHQLGGMAQGSCRMTPPATLLDANGAGVLPGGPQPFPVDAFGALGVQAGATNTLQGWPSEHTFNSRDFRTQDPNRSAERNQFYAMSVMLDQLDVDDAAQAGALGGELLAPMGLNIGCRARCSSGGTNEWWWRPGAPVALVFNDITPAMVYELDEPVMLEPGEALEVLVEVPTSWTSGQVTIDPTYKVGVAATGYAVIEG